MSRKAKFWTQRAESAEREARGYRKEIQKKRNHPNYKNGTGIKWAEQQVKELDAEAKRAREKARTAKKTPWRVGWF